MILSVNIPAELVEAFELAKGDEMEIIVVDDGIQLRPAKNKKKLWLFQFSFEVLLFYNNYYYMRWENAFALVDWSITVRR